MPWFNQGPMWPKFKKSKEKAPVVQSESSRLIDLLKQKGVHAVEQSENELLVYPPHVAPLKVSMTLKQTQLYIDRHLSNRDWNHIKTTE